MQYNDPYRNLTPGETAKIWSNIQDRISIPAHTYTPSPYKSTSGTRRLFARDYVVAALCVLLISGGGSFAAAAEQSLPTSPLLYEVKLNVIEPLQAVTKTTPEARISFNIRRTEKRLEETRELIERGELTPEIATILSENIQNHSTNAQQDINELAVTDSTQSAILSISLIETVEAKKEEITIAIATPSAEPTLLVASEPMQAKMSMTALSDQPIDVTAPSTESVALMAVEPAVINSQTESVLSILALSDSIQARATESLHTIETAQTSKDTTTENLSLPTDSPEHDPALIQFQLILTDISEKITDIDTLLAQRPAVQTPEPAVPVITELPTTPTVTESITTSTDTAVTLPTATEPTPVVSTIEIVPTAVPIPAIDPSTQVAESAPNDVTTITDEPVIASETLPLPVTVTETVVTELSPIDLVRAEFDSIKGNTSPTSADIDRARDLRKRAETILVELKSNNKKPEPAVPVPVNNADTVTPVTVLPQLTNDNQSNLPIVTEPSINLESLETSSQNIDTGQKSLLEEVRLKITQ